MFTFHWASLIDITGDRFSFGCHYQISAPVKMKLEKEFVKDNHETWRFGPTAKQFCAHSSDKSYRLCLLVGFVFQNLLTHFFIFSLQSNINYFFQKTFRVIAIIIWKTFQKVKKKVREITYLDWSSFDESVRQYQHVSWKGRTVR